MMAGIPHTSQQAIHTQPSGALRWRPQIRGIAAPNITLQRLLGAINRRATGWDNPSKAPENTGIPRGVFGLQ
jgi:hypothetical protein